MDDRSHFEALEQRVERLERAVEGYDFEKYYMGLPQQFVRTPTTYNMSLRSLINQIVNHLGLTVEHKPAVEESFDLVAPPKVKK